MLTSIHLNNYRCFRDVLVPLEPLTVFVGPNASGKTSLLHALTRNRFSDRDAFRMRSSGGWIHWADGSTTIDCTVPGGNERRAAQQYLHLDTLQLRRGYRVQEARRLEQSGADLVNVFATIPRRQQEQIASKLAELVPVLSDVDKRPGKGGNHRLVFQDKWHSEIWYEAQEVSDGTILMLALLALPYQPDPPDLVAIEEPEHGLHPYLIGEVVALLRRLAAGDVGPKPVQVVLATQSPQVLEHLLPKEVRFLDRDPQDGSVIVKEAPVDEATWRSAYEEYQHSLGSLWLSGGLGGVPGSTLA